MHRPQPRGNTVRDKRVLKPVLHLTMGWNYKACVLLIAMFPLFWRFAKTLSKEEITGIIKAHSERVVTSEFRPIYISRGNVWTTALRQFSRRRFTASTDMLYVNFASDEETDEDAEDLGGPRREFFRLLLQAIYRESGAFQGNLFWHKCYVLHVKCTTMLWW